MTHNCPNPLVNCLWLRMAILRWDMVVVVVGAPGGAGVEVQGSDLARR